MTTATTTATTLSFNVATDNWLLIANKKQRRLTAIESTDVKRIKRLLRNPNNFVMAQGNPDNVTHYRYGAMEVKVGNETYFFQGEEVDNVIADCCGNGVYKKYQEQDCAERDLMILNCAYGW